MFEKKEDKIFDYAFGDLSAHDAQIFEASLLEDQESLAEVEFLRSIKEDLVSLQDIPEMQFSKERLRSAILGQGLKPKKPIMPWVNWLLAPTALACVATLCYVLMGGTAKKEFQYVPGGRTLAMGSKPTIGLPRSSANETKVASRTENDAFPDVKDTHWASDVVRVQSHTNHRQPRHREFSGVIVSNEVGASLGVKPQGGQGSLAVAKSSAGADSKGNEIVAMANPPSNDAIKVAFGNTNSQTHDDSKLIVIDKDQDSGVGAATATEVDNTGNVLIGG